MKVTVIAGASGESAFGNGVRQFCEILRESDCEIKEWYAPFGINGFCERCMTCVREGEGKCRYSREFMPLWKSMTGADLIVFFTPVYEKGLPAAMKNLLEHLHFANMEHRPNERMFGMKALILQAGESKTAAADISSSAAAWGISAVKTFFVSPIPAESELRIAAKKACAMLVKKALPSFSTRIAFAACRKRVSGYGDCSDKKYWTEKGWLGDTVPWKNSDFRTDEKE